MKTKYKFMLMVLIFLLIVIIQTLKDINNILKARNISFEDWYWEIKYVSTNSPIIEDNIGLYDNNEEDVKIEDLYIIILPTKDGDKDLRFNMLNSISDFQDNIPELDITVVNTDNKEFNILNLKDIELIKNGVISLRGHSTMTAEEKSYKIKIKSTYETYLGYERLNLNKHPYDNFKVRNKIAFQLIEDVPNVVSIRTKLVNLYIKDLSEGKDEDFIDYGLFTNIEQIDKNYLKDHGLDPEGNLYKAEYFEFMRYEENLKERNDPDYNKEKFEVHLEIKNGNSHSKVLKMIEDVNNYNLDINKVLDKHFNRENYFTWLAINILLGNYDTQTQNFYLYSPSDSLCWFFIPWDYDDSMNESVNLKYDKDGNIISHIGVSNYWNSVLHERVFIDPKNLDELNKKIEEVYIILSKEALEREVRKYLPIVEKYYLESPRSFENIKPEAFYEGIDEIINSTSNNRKLYYETLEKPMPIYLGDVAKVDDSYLFEWTESLDLQGERVSYIFELSLTPDFQEVIFQRKRLRDNNLVVDLTPGEYYWRVIVVDSKGNTQISYDQLKIDKEKYYGIKKVTIE